MRDTASTQGKAEKSCSVNIRPGVGILSILSHLNYRPWFAMAEFVDNSIQSYLQSAKVLRRTDGEDYKLKVRIAVEPTEATRVTIRDNAAGIRESEYQRAFRPAEVPKDKSGLSEFGMGMKSAACWFSKEWVVRTAALGEGSEGTAVFNIDKIVEDKIEELDIQLRPGNSGEHYTEIVLKKLHRPLHPKTVSKIKEHLSSIFRVFIRRGDLILEFDGQPLSYEEPKILTAPFYKTPDAEAVAWKKSIDFQLGGGMRVHGFAAIRERASVSLAGFALFRRDRLIQGSGEESYRPETIFGKSNSYRHQRLFGELHLEGFEVSHTKDGFQWDENEEPFLELLKEHLNSEEMPLLDQTEGFRVRPKTSELRPEAEKAVESTADVVEREVPNVLGPQLDAIPSNAPIPEALPEATSIPARREIEVELNRCKWKITLELTNDPSIGDWLSISDISEEKAKDNVRHLGLRLSLTHPFMERFGGTDAERIEPLLRVAVALGLATVAARESGVKQSGAVKDNVNELLKDALSKP